MSSLLLADTPKSLPSSLQVDADGSFFPLFMIRLGGGTRSVHKRFSDFQALDRALRSLPEVDCIVGLAPLPRGSRGSNSMLSEDVVFARATSLAVYIRSLSAADVNGSLSQTARDLLNVFFNSSQLSEEEPPPLAISLQSLRLSPSPSPPPVPLQPLPVLMLPPLLNSTPRIATPTTTICIACHRSFPSKKSTTTTVHYYCSLMCERFHAAVAAKGLTIILNNSIRSTVDIGEPAAANATVTVTVTATATATQPFKSGARRWLGRFFGGGGGGGRKLSPMITTGTPTRGAPPTPTIQTPLLSLSPGTQLTPPIDWGSAHLHPHPHAHANTISHGTPSSCSSFASDTVGDGEGGVTSSNRFKATVAKVIVTASTTALEAAPLEGKRKHAAEDAVELGHLLALGLRVRGASSPNKAMAAMAMASITSGGGGAIRRR